jgi:outer membrane protein OmpA-like peptidoglycan-associated protein
MTRRFLLPQSFAKFLAVLAILANTAVLAVRAQAAQTQEPPSSDVVTKSSKAIGYKVGGGSTKIDLVGTELMKQANGEAKVEAKPGATSLEITLRNMASPSTLGAEFLTYVAWVVTPDGRTGLVGEVPIDKNGQGKLTATTAAQAFSLIVSAEPYFAVRVPSEMIVLENDTRKNTKGQIFVINEYKLMRKAQYEKLGNPLALTPDLKNVPLQMYEARNAVEIAKSRKADQDAPEIFTKAETGLQQAENALQAKADRKDIVSKAGQAIQFAEDARALAAQRQEERRIAAEKAAAAAQAAATAKAQAETQAAAEAAEAKRKTDEEARRQAEIAAAKEAQLKAEAEAARAKEDAARAQAAALRKQLLDQFNRVLPTTDTPRGLQANLADVLFATGKSDLQNAAQLSLAKFAGIVLAHPGLNLAVEGYTDSTGSDEFNQKLSEQRASVVESFLIMQGLDPSTVSAAGFGKSNPVAPNDTTEGRKLNRRVEMIISGEIIGVKIGSLAATR